MDITIETKMITLLGTPLSQSFAARMQNRAYEAAGLNLVYFYTELDQEHLGDVVNGLRYMNFAGFAVTKPNKVKVLEYLDELDPLCRKMGSSNTVVRTKEGKLIGYNTDGDGFYEALIREGKITAQGNRFFLIGSGGAGRAMASVLAYHGAEHIYIMDLNEKYARQLAEDVNTHFAPVAESIPCGDFSAVCECTAICNATGIGMGASIGKSPMPSEAIADNGALYFDACYNPSKTQFLKNAQEKGHRILNGLGMSLYQGAAQIRLWTGCEPPLQVMREELSAILAETVPDKAAAVNSHSF